MILAVHTDREINTRGFSVALGFCIHVNMGSGFLHTSERDYLSPMEACPSAEGAAALSLILPSTGRWYSSIIYSNVAYANIVLFFFYYSGCPHCMSVQRGGNLPALISECSSRITVAHLATAAWKAWKCVISDKLRQYFMKCLCYMLGRSSFAVASPAMTRLSIPPCRLQLGGKWREGDGRGGGGRRRRRTGGRRMQWCEGATAQP